MHRMVAVHGGAWSAWTAAIVAAALGTFGTAIYVIVHHDPVPHAGQTPSIAGALASHTPAAAATPKPPPLKVAFLGDDYTKGIGASSPGKRFTTLLAKQLGIVEQNHGIDGAGFARQAGERTYASAVDAVIAGHPDIVVVSGGRNDVTDLLSTFRTAAKRLFARLRAGLPHAVLLAVAPWWGDSDHPAQLRALDGPIKAAVHAARGRYLDLPDPLHGHRNLMTDARDPDDAGYAALAASLAPRLRSLVNSLHGR